MSKARRLQRYFLAELRAPTLLAIVLWSSLLIMNQFFLVARLAIQKDLDLATVLRLIALYIPQALVLALPMGTLLGTMTGVGRLSSDHEVVAIQGAGLGPRFFVGTVLRHGLLVTACALLVYGYVQPWASYEIRTVQSTFLSARSLTSEIRPRVFIDSLPGQVLFVEDIRPDAPDTLDGVLFYDARIGGGREQLVVARTARVSAAENPKGALQIDLRDGVLHDFRSAVPDSYRPSRFDRYVPAPLAPQQLAGAGRPPTRSVGDMSPIDLRREMEKAAAEPDTVLRPIRLRHVWIEAHKRLALPLACLILAMLALPMGMTRARSGKGAGFALSLAVILVYWLIFTSAQTQATQGNLPAGVAVWSANMVAAVWAAIALYGMRRAREPRRPFRRAARFVVRLTRLAFGGDERRSRTWERSLDELEVSPPTPVASRWVGLVTDYIARLYVRMTLLALGFAYLIFVLIEIRGLLDTVLRERQPAAQLVPYILYYSPGTLALGIPFACLIGSVATFTLLGRTGELTAMKAAGLSMRSATAPVLFATGIFCALSFVVQNQVAPETNRRALAIKDTLLGRAPRSYGVAPEGRWSFGGKGRLYHYRLYDPDRGRFQGLSVFEVDFETPRVASHRFASSATWTGSTWFLEKGWRRTFPVDDTAGEYRVFEGETESDLDPPDNFARREASILRGNDLPEQMGLAELSEQIEALSAGGYDTTRLRVAWHAKLAQPLTALVMVLLGLPFAFSVGRRGTLYGVGVALVLAIVYWAAFAVTNALGLETILAPAAAAWAPNLLFAGLGAYLMLFVRT